MPTDLLPELAVGATKICIRPLWYSTKIAHIKGPELPRTSLGRVVKGAWPIFWRPGAHKWAVGSWVGFPILLRVREMRCCTRSEIDKKQVTGGGRAPNKFRTRRYMSRAHASFTFFVGPVELKKKKNERESLRKSRQLGGPH